jgi:hypothetical protein
MVLSCDEMIHSNFLCNLGYGDNLGKRSGASRPEQLSGRSKYGLMIKTLFQTGARVDEFVHIEGCRVAS